MLLIEDGKFNLGRFLKIKSLVFIFGVVTFPQARQDPLRILPRPCEFNNIALEAASSVAGKESFVILIARPGILDRKPITQARRLHTARAYLVEYSQLREAESVVVAEAPQEEKLYYGGVEIYVNGRLQDTLTSYGDRELAVGTCSSEMPNDLISRQRRAILYPWIYPKPK